MKTILKKTAHLARLKFPDEALNRFITKAENILKYIEKLNELDTKNLEPTSHATGLSNAFRQDVVRPFPQPEAITDQAPEHLDRLVEVPRVIEES